MYQVESYLNLESNIKYFLVHTYKFRINRQINYENIEYAVCFVYKCIINDR